MKDTDIVETYSNEDNDVFKFIHANGVENCLKMAPSCTNEGVLKENNKAVLFLSSSYGCIEKCKFCYLTNKNIPYHRLPQSEIIEMVKNIIIEKRHLIKSKYIKLSFMGMGDILNENISIFDIVDEVLQFIVDEKIGMGLDGIDVGTSFPRQGDHVTHLLSMERLNDYIHEKYIKNNKLRLNPRNQYSYTHTKEYNKRTLVRLFVSLHSNQDKVRSRLMPTSENIHTIKRKLSNSLLDVVFHVMFFNDINDCSSQIISLEKFMAKNFLYDELRLLRFNKCENTSPDLTESKHIDAIIDYFKQSKLLFKYQISAGSEIKAACGQFICKK